MLEISNSDNMPTDLTLFTYKKDRGDNFWFMWCSCKFKGRFFLEWISDQRLSDFEKKVRRKFVNPYFIKNETILIKTILDLLFDNKSTTH